MYGNKENKIPEDICLTMNDPVPSPLYIPAHATFYSTSTFPYN